MPQKAAAVIGAITSSAWRTRRHLSYRSAKDSVSAISPGGGRPEVVGLVGHGGRVAQCPGEHNKNIHAAGCALTGS